ncbi:hypothetical protein [Leisingera sp. JC11]|uniref:hypothetical protein n=1 Tax=Leisingera sp. JC11 TaxID=3042469 RepID=UPI0034552815
MTLVNLSRQQGNQVSMLDLRPKVKLILQKNRTLAQSANDTYGTTIPVTAFELSDEVEFAAYTRDQLARKTMPKMSKALRERFLEAIDELFANCSLHSKSKVKVYAAGQLFPNERRLLFTISDGGVGIPVSLASSGIEFEQDADAINWAMETGNTSRHGDIPGGLGLGLLKDFIGKNGGRLIFVSRGGYWELEGKNVRKARLGTAFPGTVAVLEIDTADTKSYSLAAPINPTDIW